MGSVSSDGPVPMPSIRAVGIAEERCMSDRCALVRERFDVEVMFDVVPGRVT